VAIYILNNKREPLSKIEKKYNVRVFLNIDDNASGSGFYIEKMKGYDDLEDVTTPSPVKAPEKAKPNRVREVEEVVSNVEPFPAKNSRREHKRHEIEEKKAARVVGVDNIFEGLWRKIVE
jgi:ribonuclease E